MGQYGPGVGNSEVNIVTTQLDPVLSGSPASQPVSWQEALRRAVRNPGELCRAVGISGEFAAHAAAQTTANISAESFPVFAPWEYIARMRPGDPHDPLLRQVLPVAEEMIDTDGYSLDPVGDTAATVAPGLLHKYAGRALLIASGVCAVHCRYCFRRHFPYEAVQSDDDRSQEAITQIADDPSIHEVILSGGDPLMLVDDVLARLVGRLAKIGHVRRLRIHTRLPIVIPQRVTTELCEAISDSRLTPVVVVHANHAAELDTGVAQAVAMLIQHGAMVLNQAVLLRGVNDHVDALAELSERLIDLRVVPYYLHQLDRVAGAAHFEVPIEQGRDLVEQLRQRLPGYAVPRYVQEIAGAPYKTVLG